MAADPSRLSAGQAAVIYAAATVVMTWPLALGFGRDIPWDLGDSVLNAYILQWGADRVLAFLSGHPGALAGYWSANFFHPEPGALAYSEHLTAQVLQALPVYAATGNVVLAYNTLFLSTFILSGLGTFLFVREVTGSPRAAFVAGLIFAFTPYRIGQFSHLQVLSSQWMPFALFALARYFNTRSRWPLAGFVAALTLNNWSCGYFLLYFPPFAAAYALWEMARRRLWRDRQTWLRLAVSAAAVGLLTVPFLLPYAEVRARGFDARPMAEVAAFSADTFAYATAHSLNRVWGGVMAAFPRNEGELFTGLIPFLLLLLAGASLFVAQPGWRGHDLREQAGEPDLPRWRSVVAVAAAVSAAIHAGLLAAMVVTGGVAVKWAGVSVRATSPGRTFLLAVVSCAILMWASPRARAAIRRASASPLGFALGAMGLAWALSLGPRPTSGGHALGAWGPYVWLQAYVPGFDGLRVPARFAMIVALFGACAGAYGVRLLEQRPWFGRPALVVLCLLFLAESTTVPMLVNGTSPLADVVTPSGPVDAGPRTPPVYRAVAALPGDAVLAEFPFGVEEYELRYMLASSVHRKPLLNGYSGGFPLSYVQAKAVLGRVLAEPDRAWALLADRGVTHVVVHEGVFLRGDGARVSAWLGSRGARLIGRFGDDRLFAVGSR